MKQTVFLVTDQVPPFASILALLAVGLVAGCLLLITKKLRNAPMRRGAFVGLSLVCGIALIVGTKRAAENLGFAFHLSDLQSSIRQYQRGDYITLAGVVSDYRVDRSKGESCFRVAGSEVCTNLSEGPVGYHNNGVNYPIEDGDEVTVFYHDPVILRVDVIGNPKR